MEILPRLLKSPRLRAFSLFLLMYIAVVAGGGGVRADRIVLLARARLRICGQQNPAGCRFCGACGAELAAASNRECRKTVTVLFADVTGSTALGERLDPESFRRGRSAARQAARARENDARPGHEGEPEATQDAERNRRPSRT